MPATIMDREPIQFSTSIFGAVLKLVFCPVTLK